MINKNKTEIFLHILIVISTAAAVAAYFGGAVDALGSTGAQCFKYFTTDSNVLALIASALCIAYSKTDKKPQWLNVFRFAATVAVTITLLTVLFFLVPAALLRSKNPAVVLKFFSGNVLVLHLTTPLLSIIALMLGKEDKITKKQALWALLPVMIYSFVYLINVVFLHIWTDWYGFTFGGKYAFVPLVMLCMYAFTAAVAMLEYRLKEKPDK